MKLTKLITIRLDEETYKKIKKKTLHVSEFIRKSIDNELNNPYRNLDTKEIIKYLEITFDEIDKLESRLRDIISNQEILEELLIILAKIRKELSKIEDVITEE